MSKKIGIAALLICGGMASLIVAGNAYSRSSSSKASSTAASTAPSPEDIQLATAVNAALGAYSGKINVAVKAGVVSLAGQVPADTDYEKAIVLAESVKGVSDVNVDKLTVKDNALPLYDTYLAAKVKGALIQAGLQGTDASTWTVNVEAKDGQVFLSGSISTEQDKQKAIATVKNIKGVTKVNDKLTVGQGAPAAGTTPENSDTNATSGSKENDSEDDDSDDDEEEDSRTPQTSGNSSN